MQGRIVKACFRSFPRDFELCCSDCHTEHEGRSCCCLERLGRFWILSSEYTKVAGSILLKWTLGVEGSYSILSDSSLHRFRILHESTFPRTDFRMHAAISNHETFGSDENSTAYVLHVAGLVGRHKGNRCVEIMCDFGGRSTRNMFEVLIHWEQDHVESVASCESLNPSPVCWLTRMIIAAHSRNVCMNRKNIYIYGLYSVSLCFTKHRKCSWSLWVDFFEWL